jgi:hypothetical protein
MEAARERIDRRDPDDADRLVLAIWSNDNDFKACDAPPLLTTLEAVVPAGEDAGVSGDLLLAQAHSS